MNNFNRCNKVTGIHWLKNSPENLNIKIKLKPLDEIISLPKFEDYSSESKAGLILEKKVEKYSLKWQEKVFSSWELQRFEDTHNCLTDIELKYHDMIKHHDCVPSKIFTYIHEDYYLPLPVDVVRKKTNQGILNLNSCLERLNLNGTVGIIRRAFGGGSVSMGHLFKSEESICMDEEQWIAMHIVFDNSTYNEDCQLVLKQETTLLSLYHNTTHNYLIISPDVNNLELNPYAVESAGTSWGYQYAVDLEFEGTLCGDELTALLRKLCNKWEKKHKQLVNFVIPSIGKKLYYLTLDILTATGFDKDNLYIEFNVKLSEGLQCNDKLHGRTHTSEAIGTDDGQCNFGHVLELCFEFDANLELLPLQIFFEAISIDWWGRHRTEGYSYLALSLDPGRYTKQLSCSRPEEVDRVEAESRRFFVGGCNLIKDLDVLAKPQLKDADFVYKTMGNINISWNIVSQTGTSAAFTAPAQPGSSSASALLQGAEAALRKYCKARARLAAATKDLTDVKYEVCGDG